MYQNESREGGREGSLGKDNEKWKQKGNKDET